jgi:hypothetical protein
MTPLMMYTGIREGELYYLEIKDWRQELDGEVDLNIR